MSAIHSDIFNRVDIERLRDKGELPLCVIALIFSFAVYALLTYLALSTAENPEIIDIANEFIEELGVTEITEEFIDDLNVEEVIQKWLLKIGALFVLAALVIVFIVTYLRFVRNVGETVSCDIPVTDWQFPYLKEKCSAYAQRLGLDYVPELYISQEGSAEVETSSVKFRSEYYIRLNCDYVRVAAEDEDFSPVDFMIGIKKNPETQNSTCKCQSIVVQCTTKKGADFDGIFHSTQRRRKKPCRELCAPALDHYRRSIQKSVVRENRG